MSYSSLSLHGLEGAGWVGRVLVGEMVDDHHVPHWLEDEPYWGQLVDDGFEHPCTANPVLAPMQVVYQPNIKVHVGLCRILSCAS